MKKFHNTNATITADNIQQIANAITIRALKTNYAKSGNEMIRQMLNDAMQFAHNPSTRTGQEGADLIQDTVLYLWQYAGRRLTDATDDGQTDKEGKPIDILRGAFRNIRKIIYGHEQRQYTQLYIEDYEQGHGEIALPRLWDISSYHDYMTVDKIITSLQLNENQKAILNKRMQGYSLAEIARVKGITKQAVANTLAKIGKKYLSIYGTIKVR